MNKPSATSIFPPTILIIALFASAFFYGIIAFNNDIFQSNAQIELILSFMVLISTALIIFHRPIWGISIIVLFLPLKSLWPEFSNEIFSGIPLVTSFIVIIGSLTITSTLVHVLDKKIPTPRITWHHFAALLFVLWIGFSHFDSITAYVGGRIWFWTYIQLLGLMVIGTILITSTNSAKVFGYSIIAGTLISVIGGTLTGGFEISEEATFRVRLAGLHGNPNEFAIMCIISLICLNYFIPSVNNKLLRILMFSAMPFMFFGLAFSISRTGLIAAIIVASIMLFLKFRIQVSNILIKSTPVALFVIGFIILISVLPAQYRDLWFGSIQREISNRTGTTEVRLEIWKISIDSIKENPITGIGAGRFKSFAENKWTLDQNYRERAVHNTYLGIMTEMGMVGFLLFSIFNLAIFYELIVYSRNKGLAMGNENISYMFFLVLVVWAIFGLFGNGEYGKILWLVNGASLGLINAQSIRPVTSTS